MTETSTFEVGQVQFLEPFRQYAVNWEQTSVRTDTPDLLGYFEDALMADGAAEFAEEDLEMAEADMGAGVETLLPE